MGPSTAMRVTVKPKSSTLPLSHQRTVSNCRSSHVNLDAIFQFRFAGFSGAVDAAENLSVGFNTVSHNPAVALRANRRQRVDRALEAVEDVRFPLERDLECLVIFISAMFAFSHKFILHFYILFRWVVIEIDQAFRPRVGISFTR